MKVVIVGAGAVGGFIGIHLQKVGHEVTFIARGEHLRALEVNGFKMLKNDDSFVAEQNFTDEFHALAEADYAVLTVKGTETESIVKQMKPYLSEQAKVITFQNGVSNEELLVNTFGRDRVLSGVAHISVQVLEPGVISQHGPHLFMIGALGQENHEFAKRFVNACEESGIKVKYSAKIMQQKWEKCLWNITFNPVSAIARATVGDMLDDEKLRISCEELLKEAVLISEKAGFPMSETAIERVFVSSEKIRKHKTSMLQDVEKGKKMEVYSLCGYFVERAKQLEIEVPVLETVYNLLQFIDRNTKQV